MTYRTPQERSLRRLLVLATLGALPVFALQCYAVWLAVTR